MQPKERIQGISSIVPSLTGAKTPPTTGGKRKRGEKLKRKSKDAVLKEWFSWINSTNAELLALAFEDWIKEQGYHVTRIEEK